MSIFRFFNTAILTLSSFLLFSQEKLTLEKIWTGAFRPQSLKEIQHLKNGVEFTYLEYDKNSTKIIAENYKTGDTRILLSDSLIRNLPIRKYTFSKDQNSILIGTTIESIYRYSTKGKYIVYNFENKTTTVVADEWIINPSFSPDATKIAFVKDNNIYIKNLTSGTVIQLTHDGHKNNVINGLSDWVYEEEFELIEAYKWSPDSKKIAFLRFDESKVREYQMPIYLSGNNYPDYYTFKYPKAGEENSDVRAFVYDLDEEHTDEILFQIKPYYIPRLQWQNKDVITFQTLNRHQNNLSILAYDVKKAKTNILYKERDTAYVEINNHLDFIDEGFYFTSEKDGFNHIYFQNKKGQTTQLTKGKFEVQNVYGFDPKTKSIFYQSNEGNEIEQQIYCVNLNGNKKQITMSKGIHSASFSKDFRLFIDTFANSNTPTSYNLISSVNGLIIKTLKNNNTLKNVLAKKYHLPKKEFGRVSLNNHQLNYYIIKPFDFDPSKKYPVLLYQYSGPGSQQVKNNWHSYNDYWHYLLSKKGYIIACVDGRGTGGKGANFKKLTQLQLGKLEAEDQIAFAKYLGKENYVDKNRLGIWGWSFGGFTALNAVLKDNTIFKAAISVAPVTHWGFYDTIYTERFLHTPQENLNGYNDNSPISLAQNLNCALLLVHGSADDNVHLQNSLQMSEAFVRYNKPFDQEIYTNKNHGIYGGYTRLHLFKKMTDFILQKL